MPYCNNCPNNPSCEECLNLIDGGTLRRKVSPPLPITLQSVSDEKVLYHGELMGISRKGMIIRTDAPSNEYIAIADNQIRVRITPIFHPELTGVLAFDIAEVYRDNFSDHQLSSEEYDYFFVSRKDLVTKLTEHLDEKVKSDVQKKLENEMIKAELFDSLITGGSFRFLNGKLTPISNKTNTILSENELVNIMQTAIKTKDVHRELVVEPLSDKYYDIHAIPLGTQAGGILILDVSSVIKKERELLKQQWENYKEIIQSLTRNKIILIRKDELNEILESFTKRNVIPILSSAKLSDLRESIKSIIQSEGIHSGRSFGFVLAIHEALTNVIKHAKEGEIEFWVNENQMLVLVKDQGNGIALQDIPKATIINGYSTKATLGVGFHLIAHYSDKVYLLSNKSGTTVGLLLHKYID